ncbi:MAG: hypothetical protein A3G52_01875 [Candidatus Taylorbacteria bacterium RIFCSPLOWO2_12_FULL_43_20]|uniref:Uncharacterized protein n=1 Tax=Candidatus Taylorbacteria bacterium RIFCSPLOWO2_12_FULL_43_20 TaxID=1802332 RepID=A0A1G2P3P8_9BACT|nr:MAG: hypothetical protein A2825_01970 [Candidatus Taylorbacteria bacterium RIFCSPHIGHO2_01_FULL_43_120]OHA23000.1 MAG: hypothetical protein A3B98_01845 [Candidatus Taylorbacteria bacterium RIFCSPHIGHO2_02_FULL_43_55]OHA30116.1 MAG: hypothetical protein A3E92_00880 [Candidatus Taylorbacteria bacterium RIFCSPHIGHO2_12_FULL_42_34]OHA30714.1 MAG: hypothetical protein A3B09_01635 [Candidatus Taylorbacteria bacterium RIFCSPLOWO2_01_FULL_43_83]OHA39587.1 MAG: hypothetical protein A3H58_02320 [Candi
MQNFESIIERGNFERVEHNIAIKKLAIVCISLITAGILMVGIMNKAANNKAGNVRAIEERGLLYGTYEGETMRYDALRAGDIPQNI